MSIASAEPAAVSDHSLSAMALPWLLSTTAHTAIFVGLALTVGLSRSAPTPGGVTLEATFLSTRGDQLEAGPPGFIDGNTDQGFYDDDAGPTPSASLLDSASPADPLNTDPQTANSQTTNSNSPNLLASAGSPGTGLIGGSPGISSLLNEKPTVNLPSMLPTSGGAGGSGGTGAAVGAAPELTGQARGGNRTRGGGAKTGVFGVRGEGHKFVYVFDRSGSMDGHNGAPLGAAKSELIGSLADLGQVHQFQIIFYNEQPRVFNPSGSPGRLVFGTDQNKNLARKFVGSITASGATRHEEALEMALRMSPDVIFFLTDADEPRMTAKQLAHLSQMNRGTSINAIEFGFGAQRDTDNFLVKLARQNGGQHVYVDISRLSQARR